MKKIYEAVKSIQKPPVRYRHFSVDEDYNNECNIGDDYSEDEGTSAPISHVHSANTLTSKPDELYSKLLSGYTKDNWEINVNNLNTRNKFVILIFFYYYNFRLNHYRSICLKMSIVLLTFATIVVL